jgi:hypothetical protein
MPDLNPLLPCRNVVLFRLRFSVLMAIALASAGAAAYGVRGQARGLTGDLHGADQDLAKAEDLERATFEVPRKPEKKAFDTHALKSMLGFHAEVLTALGKKPNADKLRDEAKKL